ncbi:MAG: AAA family ATPase [Myxococcales bacterium]|jgi:AAA15 family ATPase/GTPase|nr:AAA family ATPase [Myxococcales bacterium]
MLIRFTIENWMSFLRPVTFTMVATKERQHGERVPRVGRYATRVLPIASIYGGNASGKSNFFRALNFARTFVVRGTQPDARITVEPFRLDARATNAPTRFEFELLANDTIYAYAFAVTQRRVVSERLVQVLSTTEKVLFERNGDDITFDSGLNSDRFLHFAFRGTRANQLFLTNTVSQTVDNFLPVYSWFKETLVLIAPDMRFAPFEDFIDESSPLFGVMCEMLPGLDTGIRRLGGEEIPFDSLPLAEHMKSMLQESVGEGETVRLTGGPNNERLIVHRDGGVLKARKLVALHERLDGTEVRFDLGQESDGSQRVIDLLPAFLDIASHRTPKVYIIDELDRSLHTLLTRNLLDFYLRTCSENTRSQLLITTHDLLLMDQDMFRRDEMWITERDQQGVTTLTSFSEFKDVRYDKDIRKSYLQGRLGGVPTLRVRTSHGLPTERHETRERPV